MSTTNMQSLTFIIYKVSKKITAFKFLPHTDNQPTTFSDLDCISRSQQCQIVLTENVMFLFNQEETLYDC